MSQNIIISSEFIEAEIDLFGAELKGLCDLDTGVDYVWRGDEKFWPRSAPILFPIVGKLKDDEYWIGKKRYHMTQHGFARDSQFELVSHSKDFVHLRLDANIETLKLYPYKFSLDVKFKVYGPKLLIDYDVQNMDRSEMLFSIGSHPALNIPFIKEDKLEDYYIEFEEEENVGAYYLENGLVNFSNFSDRSVFQGKKIFLTRTLFNDDALIFKDLKSKKITIKNVNNNYSLTVSLEECPYLGIWAKPGAPFVCIEPWHGVADSVNSKNDFYEKEGLITLESGKSFQSSYSLFVS